MIFLLTWTVSHASRTSYHLLFCNGSFSLVSTNFKDAYIFCLRWVSSSALPYHRREGRFILMYNYWPLLICNLYILYGEMKKEKNKQKGQGTKKGAEEGG